MHAPVVKSQNDAESLMWALLRDRRLVGFKFRRQHAVDPYVLEFYCHDQRLVVELDGGNTTRSAAAAPTKRTRFLAKQKLRVLRSWNHDVLQDTETVLEAF